MKFLSTQAMDDFIDEELCAIPYDAMLCAKLSEEDTKTITDFADELKKVLKFINNSLTWSQKKEMNFTKESVAKKFRVIMFSYSGKKIIETARALWFECETNYGRELIDDFCYYKQIQLSEESSDAERYRKELRDTVRQIEWRTSARLR